MLPPDQLGLWRQLPSGDTGQLWAYTRTVDRQRFGPAAATTLVLRNAGPAPLHIRDMDIGWQPGGTVVWNRPGHLEPGASWVLLDTRSFDALVALARQHGRRGFGLQGTVHTVTVNLDQPGPARLPFEVGWGFATPNHDLGFFLPVLDDLDRG